MRELFFPLWLDENAAKTAQYCSEWDLFPRPMQRLGWTHLKTFAPLLIDPPDREAFNSVLKEDEILIRGKERSEKKRTGSCANWRSRPIGFHSLLLHVSVSLSTELASKLLLMLCSIRMTILVFKIKAQKYNWEFTSLSTAQVAILVENLVELDFNSYDFSFWLLGEKKYIHIQYIFCLLLCTITTFHLTGTGSLYATFTDM